MKRFFAAFFSIVFILITPLTIYLTIIENRLFTPQGMKVVVRASGIGERLPDIVGAIVDSQSDETTELVDQIGGKEELHNVVSELLPSESVYSLLDQSIDTLFSWWVTGKPVETIPLVIDLEPLKARIAPTLISSLERHLDTLPPCSVDQLSSEQLDDVLALPCVPPGFSIGSIGQVGISDEMLAGIVLRGVPSQYAVSEYFTDLKESDPARLQRISQQVEQSRALIRIGRIVLRVLQVLTVLSFILVGVLRLLPMRSFFSWIGWVLLLPGLEILVSAGLTQLIPNLPTSLSTQADIRQFVVVNEMVEAIVATFAQSALWIGVIFSAAGCICIIVSFLLQRQARTIVSPPVPSQQKK